MEHADVRRLALVLAVQAKIDGMKIANDQRDLPAQAPAYTEEDFKDKASELENLAYAHDEQLFG